MESEKTLVSMEIWHRDYNLSKKDNLDELPSESAVFGIFGSLNEKPANCRYVGATDNLRAAVKALFGNTVEGGLRKFMQGPWVPILQYDIMPDATADELEEEAGRWTQQFNPGVDEDGDYPGYYY